MSFQSNSIKCIQCGKPATKEGFKISWDIEDLNLGEREDSRYFCSLDCIEKWINTLGITEFEEIIPMDRWEISQMRGVDKVYEK